MQDPVYEVTSVIKGIVQAQNATLQRDTLRKYYAPDASFDHPFYLVGSSASSRETGILPIYQWQRCLYIPQVEVHNVGFDKESNKIFLDVTQRWVPTFLPKALYAPTLRSIIVLYLQRGADGRFYVKRQEDYYQPQTLPGKLIPGFDIVILLSKRICTFICLLLALFCRVVFRHWRPVAQ
ncbi:uncharacterized protein FA14DRAFT_174618 [Meira miltonrushii]|uniref:SigF-like NTF2-like domain-containing protein n=1 Tax=Meira miltonrushii TaxID=1280837 RepID=A0A316V6A7_9BASI|nr:uncharacterized protein FA14DRAFT_174618 [Meira miltonrushii]PWN32972.1 hypothetical protein FA14DRAFT_174618 [Meira miltonrushii]